MALAYVAITHKGVTMAEKLRKTFPGDVYTKEQLCTENMLALGENVAESIRELYMKYEDLVFLIECNFVIRCIKDCVGKPDVDPTIVVMDEEGKYAIALMSGRLGGANRLARSLAWITGGQEVITTPPALQNVPEFDAIAKQNGSIVENIKMLRHVTNKLVHGDVVYVYTDRYIKGGYDRVEVVSDLTNMQPRNVAITSKLSITADVLILRPKDLILGVSCGVDTSYEQLEKAVLAFMSMQDESPISIRMIAVPQQPESVPAAQVMAKKLLVPLRCADVQQEIQAKEYLEQRNGAVCAASICACAFCGDGEILKDREIYNGIELSLFQKKVDFVL